VSLSVDEVPLDELAQRAQRGDAASFERIVVRLRRPLVAFLARRLCVPQDADDVAQETFDRAYRNLSSYDPTRKFSTWLFTIGKHAASNFQSAQQRRQRLERQVEIEPTPAPVLADEDADTWQRARKILSAEVYRALWLRYACDFSVREVAREIGKSVVGTKVMLFRARAKLLDEAV
jgi:RNA polymerase sigma-70 factor, ECF subfamily